MSTRRALIQSVIQPRVVCWIGVVVLMTAASGCASAPRSSNHDRSPECGLRSETSPAAISGEALEPDFAELLDEAPDRRTPPPRLMGKVYHTAVVRDGATHRVEIRVRDGVAETRVNGTLIPPDRVLVHRRGEVEIVDRTGATELSFRLPRGMTSVSATGR